MKVPSEFWVLQHRFSVILSVKLHDHFAVYIPIYLSPLRPWRERFQWVISGLTATTRLLSKLAQPLVWYFWWSELQAPSVKTALCYRLCSFSDAALPAAWQLQLENKEIDDANRRSVPKAGWNSGKASAAWILNTVLLNLVHHVCVIQLGQSIQALLTPACFPLVLFPVILEDIWK